MTGARTCGPGDFRWFMSRGTIVSAISEHPLAWGLARRVMQFTCTAVLSAAGVDMATAQSYPTRPMTFVVPFPAGGPVDIVARLIGKSVGEKLGQPVVVENKAGASSTIGAGAVARATPDGHTLLVTATTHTVTASTFASLPYDPINDFAPVALVGKMPMLVVTHAGVPAKTLAEFTAYAKANPGKLNYATGSSGGTAHLMTAMVLQRAGITMSDIPYKGSAPAVLDLLAGRVDLYFDVPGIVLAHVREGKLKALAVTTSTRLPAIADVPTIAESGYPGFDASIWMGVLAPARTPEPILDRLNLEINKTLKEPELVQRLEKEGYLISPAGRREWGEFLRQDAAQWAPIVKSLGIKPQ